MKNSIALFALLIATATIGVATPKNAEVKNASQIALVQAKENVYNLIYPFIDDKKVEVTIKDELGNVIMNDQIINKSGFMKPYNFSAQKDGQYTFEISDGTSTIQKNLLHTSPRYARLIKKDNKRIQLIVAPNEPSSFSLQILDQADKLVFEEFLAESSGFTRVYDLTKINSSYFTFKVAGKNVNQILSTK